MKRVSLLAIALLVLGGCGGGEGGADGGNEGPVITYFENGNLIVGDGSPLIEDAAIVVNDGIITDFGPREQVEHPPGADRYDLSEHTIVPFLVNLHGHVGYHRVNDYGSHNYNRENVLLDLDRYLYYGVGAVAVMGTDLGDTAFEIRSEQQSGQLSGARIFTAGRGITARGGFPSTREDIADVPIQVGTEEEAREAVRGLAAQNVDFVKIWVDDNRQVSGQVFRFGQRVNNYSSDPKLSPALYGAIIDEAHQNNIRVVAHVRYLADAKGLVAAGVDGLIHSVRDRPVDQALIDAMLANGVFYTPTLARHEIEFAYGDEPDWVRESFLRESVSGAVISRLTNPTVVASYRDNLNAPMRRQEFETAMENFKTLYDAGVRVGLGTDSGAAETFPGFFEHRELELMVQAGLTPLQAIQVGAQFSPEILGIDDLGVLTVGNPGNFTVVPGDPTQDIRATRNIADVIYHGDSLARSTMMTNFSN